jgi:two-component system cell cycle sensor histidine kinase/response regulator CckA
MRVPFKKETELEGGQSVQWSSEVTASEILHSLPDAVFTTDRQMRINYFNRAAAAITGFRAFEAIGMYCKDILKSSICETECPIKRALDSHQNIFNIETALTTIEKIEIPILISASLLVGSSGEVVGYMHVFRDISTIRNMLADLERSRNELAQRNIELDQTLEELRSTQEQLLQAQKMEAMGTLAGGIAHDFNNVLMGIQGHTSLLLLDTDPEHPHFGHLKGAEDLVKRGAELTRQLLGFARGGKYEVKPTDLNDLINESLEMFGRTKREIRIHTKYEKKIWPVEVDRSQIEQVLLNLYVNAWQAMPDGGDLYIETKNVAIDTKYAAPFGVEPGNYSKISVTDTGPGMDTVTQQKIFDPFFTTKEIGRGTGLGLSSAYGVIRNHGGIINVYSEEGKGSTFNIYLPASEKEVTVKKTKPSEGILQGTETVLLVDDEEAILEVGKEMLETMGYTVLLARNGKEAVDVYLRHVGGVDLVVLDIVMPDMSGSEVYDRIREITPQAKVVLSSGYSINEKASEILRRGCDGFIQKPFNMKEFSGKVREILDAK